MEFSLTEHNPDYEEIREKGFAFIIEPMFPETSGQHGSPYLDESYDAHNPERVCAIWWDESDVQSR